MTDFAELARQYLILIEGGPPSNYSAWSPHLPGCVAVGDTLEEVESEMRDAIAFHLEGMTEAGDPIRDPSGPGGYVARLPRRERTIRRRELPSRAGARARGGPGRAAPTPR